MSVALKANSKSHSTPDLALTRHATPRRGRAGVWERTLVVGLAGSFLMWASLPPLDWGWLGWVALAPWVEFVRRPSLQGTRPFVAVWFSGFAFWMGTLHWLRLPHWLTGFGWVVLSAYLACYLPCFVAIGRFAVHGLRIPVLAAVPIVWTGLDYARAYLVTGFNMSSLAHSQHSWLDVIQIADLVGEYGVTFALAFFAACAAMGLNAEGNRRWWPLVSALLMLLAVVGYGRYRISATNLLPGPRIALVQTNIDAQFDGVDRRQEILDQCLALSTEVLDRSGGVDLIVWPESMFPEPILTWRADITSGDVGDSTDRLSIADVRRRQTEVQQLLAQIAAKFQTPWILNGGAIHFERDATLRFNTSLLLDRDGEITARYDKMHPVMFGEYVPFGKAMPWLYRPPMPISAGLDAGKGGVPFQIGEFTACPSICYETILPHVIGTQVRELRSQGKPPDLLVNVTNDGWFWGSSELDLHLISGVFRAVENRRPLVIAANTGFSAYVDSTGAVRAQGPRHATGSLVAEVELDARVSPYSTYGDWFAGSCLLATMALGIVALSEKPLAAQFSRRNGAGGGRS